MPREIFAGGQLKLLRDEDIDKVHAAALRILEETGIAVPHAEALDIYKKGGAEVDAGTGTAKLPPETIERALADSPSEIVLCGRDEANDLVLSGTNVYAGTGGAELNVLDLETGKLRPSSLKDVADLARLVDGLANIDFYIRPVVARDVPQEKLDVNKYYVSLANTGKHVMGNVYYREKVREVLEMAAIIAGGMAELRRRPIISFITSWMSSPLKLNSDVTGILIEIVRRGMPVALSSVAILGLTSPVTMAGNLALTHAEQLSGIVLGQLINPGAPIIYGGCPGTADMRDASFCPGSIERGIMNAAVTQLARHIGVPNYNLAGVTDSKLPDVQAGYEKAFGVCLTALTGSNYIHHAAGRIVDGVAYEQYVIDNEIIGMAKRVLRGIRVDDESLAVSQIKAAGPGGGFIDSEHTIKHYREELYVPSISDRSRRAVWEKAGSRDGRERARAEAKRILAEHRPPPIPVERDREIRRRFEILYSGT